MASRKLHFEEFIAALSIVAEEKGVSSETIQGKICKAGGPKTNTSRKQDQNDAIDRLTRGVATTTTRSTRAASGGGGGGGRVSNLSNRTASGGAGRRTTSGRKNASAAGQAQAGTPVRIRSGANNSILQPASASESSVASLLSKRPTPAPAVERSTSPSRVHDAVADSQRRNAAAAGKRAAAAKAVAASDARSASTAGRDPAPAPAPTTTYDVDATLHGTLFSADELAQMQAGFAVASPGSPGVSDTTNDGPAEAARSVAAQPSDTASADLAHPKAAQEQEPALGSAGSTASSSAPAQYVYVASTREEEGGTPPPRPQGADSCARHANDNNEGAAAAAQPGQDQDQDERPPPTAEASAVSAYARLGQVHGDLAVSPEPAVSVGAGETPSEPATAPGATAPTGYSHLAQRAAPQQSGYATLCPNSGQNSAANSRITSRASSPVPPNPSDTASAANQPQDGGALSNGGDYARLQYVARRTRPFTDRLNSAPCSVYTGTSAVSSTLSQWADVVVANNMLRASGN